VATALITGIGGQDGSYMAEFLLEKGYRVIGAIRDLPPVHHQRLASIHRHIQFEKVNLLEDSSIRLLLEKTQPAEVYNFAARASSSHLFDSPALTAEINAITVVRFLEAARIVNPAIRFCQASSSEIFGTVTHSPQDESTPLSPRNPYGIAKMCGHWFVVNYRQIHGSFACSAILYNHESPRRGLEFVTRKISRAVAQIKAGLQSSLTLGDLEARRDWGYAGDYVRGMWQMLQRPEATDYVLATGEAHTVREFCDIAFSHAGLRYEKYVISGADERRRPEPVPLVGNPAKARELLGWYPSVSFAQLVCMMVDEDMRAVDNIDGVAN
jgi:GDPmannose 4,6-dehydratase